MSNLRAAVQQAFDYLVESQIEIPTDLLIAARMKGIKAKAKQQEGGDLSSINAAYHDAITAALTSYLEGGSVTGPRNQFKRAATVAFGDAMDMGTVDGGGELPFVDDALAWFNARLNQEFANIESVFVQAKELRKDPDADLFAWASARADGYTRSLSGVYNAAVLFAKGNQLLTWHLGQTEKHCDTCSSLNDTRHRASWYISHDYIPRKPGAGMDCGGYNCDCSLTDPKGNEVSI
jgi:hypothetical protein